VVSASANNFLDTAPLFLSKEWTVINAGAGKVGKGYTKEERMSWVRLVAPRWESDESLEECFELTGSIPLELYELWKITLEHPKGQKSFNCIFYSQDNLKTCLRSYSEARFHFWDSIHLNFKGRMAAQGIEAYSFIIPSFLACSNVDVSSVSEVTLCRDKHLIVEEKDDNDKLFYRPITPIAR